MKITKVLNNNVVLALNNSDEEMVVMGRGIAFQKKTGDDIEAAKIEKTFVPEDKAAADNMTALFKDISPEVVAISTETIIYAQKVLHTELSSNVFLSLADHLNLAINRTREGLVIVNPLVWEVKKFYKQEYDIGIKALDNIYQQLGVKLPEEEAASIALHIVNAKETDQQLGTTVKVTAMVQDILTIIRLHFGIVFDEDSFNFTRFITHLQYTAQRLMSKEHPDHSSDDFLYDQVKVKYPNAFACTEKISDYIQKTYHKTLSKEEQTYLTIHIQRVTTK